MKKVLLLIAVVIQLTGCASVQMGDAAEDTRLKSFPTVSADKAGIYVYRNEMFGAAIKAVIEIDDKHLGQTASKTYLYKEVTPGKHTITVRSEKDHSLTIDAKGGTLTYIWQEMKMGMFAARAKLHLMSEEKGRKGVMEGKLAYTK